jgi:hypothetical protein
LIVNSVGRESPEWKAISRPSGDQIAESPPRVDASFTKPVPSAFTTHTPPPSQNPASLAESGDQLGALNKVDGPPTGPTWIVLAPVPSAFITHRQKQLPPKVQRGSLTFSE